MGLTTPSVFPAEGTGAREGARVEAKAGGVTLPDAVANDADGVACKRRHSSGLRCSKDKPSPRVKVRANCEPARRAA